MLHGIFTRFYLTEFPRAEKYLKWAVKGINIVLDELPNSRQKVLPCVFYIALRFIGIQEVFLARKNGGSTIYNVAAGFDHKTFFFIKHFLTTQFVE